MKHHEHRLCTKLLCVILVIANILSVGMPVYAKSPDMSLDKTASIDSEKLLPSILESEMPGASDNTESGTGPKTVSGNSPDSEFDHSKPNLDSDTEENSGDDDSNSDPNTNSNDETDTETKDSDNFENTNNIDETENDSVSNNDTSPDKKVANENQAYGDSEYLTEDPQGYDLFDIHMMPGSYSAELSATSNQGNIREHSFKILYTTDNALADDFFKGSSKISENDLTESGIKLASFNSLKGKYRYDDSLNKNVFDISASFTGENILNPATTYYYRLVHCSWDSANQTNYYYFLTVPARFTTEAPLTKSSVSIKDIVDDIGYQQAKVIWTIDNPNNEFISAIKLQ